MAETAGQLPLPKLDALPLGAHRLFVLTDPGLQEANGVTIAFTSREGGMSTGPFASLNCGGAVGDDPQAVRRNRELVLEALGASESPVVIPNQVHGTQLVTVKDRSAVAVAEAQSRSDEGCDGVVVAAADVAALLNFADCLPLIIVAPRGDFAVVHGGWRGTVAHIASKAVVTLAQLSGEDPQGFNAYIGPHIRPCCFEVDPDLAQRFHDEFGPEAVRGERHVSLAAAVSADLASAGIPIERIADAGICTVDESESYFSYRASGGCCGRHSAVAIRQDKEVRP